MVSNLYALRCTDAEMKVLHIFASTLYQSQHVYGHWFSPYSPQFIHVSPFEGAISKRLFKALKQGLPTLQKKLSVSFESKESPVFGGEEWTVHLCACALSGLRDCLSDIEVVGEDDESLEAYRYPVAVGIELGAQC